MPSLAKKEHYNFPVGASFSFLRDFTMQRMLIILGIVLVAAGLLWPWLSKLPLGRLPGDIFVERDNLRFYFPITTGIVVSLIISLLLWIFRR